MRAPAVAREPSVQGISLSPWPGARLHSVALCVLCGESDWVTAAPMARPAPTSYLWMSAAGGTR